MQVAPRALTRVPIGSQVHLRLNSGQLIDSQTYGMDGIYSVSSDASVEVLSLAFARVISRHLSIPQECISIMWNGARAYDANESIYETVVHLSACDDERSREAEKRTRNEEVCVGCYWPCPAIDRNRRFWNCVECGAENLCNRCKVITANGLPHCLLCLEQDDVPILMRSASREDLIRYRVIADHLHWADTGI